ncbi:hypothetical protein PRJBM_00505 [Bartonella henselae]|uniref:Uncharacterized protein n=1 Tax=Bartonella henselae TaxID=38323 RepID=X5LSR7_BARHN|nr:hypothetical protein Q653_00984 [Bartonella henselae JK 42]ETS09943.1 hypothetical protein Q654_00221 [Bartonella henselae JK 50]ETS10453.1 hypothetical protein Q655_00172 [Bartonella henselae JK 51]ETS12307.1 hypothetical protein Q652_01112 [Bartonella henselae JK 41]KEC57988.1 hypothetical protein O97_00517 [Bartonella henselae str. Zeus]KEC62340.1 hypothetical protein O95_00802 [Bartonella henselae JK 53]CDO39895.1 hypothetical protein PRJBM_00505 [Bartonella henselae]
MLLLNLQRLERGVLTVTDLSAFGCAAVDNRTLLGKMV